MGLSVDTAQAWRRPSDLQALAAAVRDADDADESHWLEWKSTLDLNSKAGRYAIARAILGFANRDPDRAVRDCGGCAYLIVGAEPRSVQGVTPVDPAHLESGVAVYLGGSNGPVWSPMYVTVDGTQVLVVTVESPTRGDRPYPLRKTFHGDNNDGADDGTIFVRHHGKTERAKAADMDMLADRAAGAPAVDVPVDLTLSWAQPPDVPVCDTAVGKDDWLQRERAVLMASAKEATPEPRDVRSALTSVVAARNLMEPRSRAEYQAEVDAYIADCDRRWQDVILSRCHLHQKGRLVLVVENSTEQNVPAVEVQIQIPDTVWVFPNDFDEIEFARPPAPFGDKHMYMALDTRYLLDIPRAPMPYVPSRRTFWVSESGDTVTFSPIDLRPRQRETLSGFHVIVSPQHPGSSVTLRWTLTSTAFNGVRDGTIDFSAGDTLTAAELLNEPEDS